MSSSLDAARGVHQAFAVGDIPVVMSALAPDAR
jgi:hypothetical protein